MAFCFYAKRLLAVIVLVLPASTAVAQQSPKVEVFGGYSVLHLDTQGFNGAALDSICNAVFLQPQLCAGAFAVHQNLNGWNAAAQVNVNRWFGLKADFSGHYSTLFTATPAAQSFLTGVGVTAFPLRERSYSFLFGPVAHQNMGRYSPFVHALFGANRLSTRTIGSGPPLLVFSTFTIPDTALAIALGGGVDVKLTNHILVRVAQVDCLLTKHDFGSENPHIATHQNNLRASAGLVFIFGSQSVSLPSAANVPPASIEMPVLGVVVLPYRNVGGAEVVRLTPRGPAALAGMQVGDVINAVDGRTITSPTELAEALANRHTGTKVVLGFLVRGYWQSEAAVVLGDQH